jgi:eukaryotic-like serine/threonine-protein kinase
MRTTLLCLALMGCADDGVVVTEWTLYADGRELGQVKLPGDLAARVGDARRYRLVTEWIPPAAWRGRELTMGVGYLGGPTQLRVDGVKAAPLNHSLTLSAAQGWHLRPDGDRVVLEMEVDHISWFSGYFGAAPRLSDDPRGPPAYRRALFFNVLCALISVVTMATLAIAYGFAWLLDRRRRAYGLYALMTLLVIPFELGNVGLVQPLVGDAHVAVAFACAGASALTSVFFVHATFQLPPPPRAFRLLVIPLVLTVVFAHDPWRGARWVMSMTFLLTLPCIANNVVRVWRLARRRSSHEDRLTMWLVLCGWLAMLAAISADLTMLLGKNDWLDGTIGNPVGLTAFALLNALVLGRDQVMKSRLARQLNRELQHQVIERSRQLAEALTRSGEAAPLAAGSIVAGRYRLTALLGAGAMGCVYECVRLSDEKSFALKVLIRHAEANAMARFMREAQIAAELDHPNLVAVHDAGITDDGTPYLVMDRVDGSPLQLGGIVSAPAVLLQIARGLHAIHARGIVHRDLKPANVLVGRDGRVRIADFGIARVAGGPAQAQLTLPGRRIGTPLYMAPELADGSSDAQSPADLFSFGVIAYQALCGRPPFDGAPLLARMEGRALPEPPPLENVAAPIADVIRRCLRFDPAERPTAEEAVNVFAAAAD